MSDELYEKKRRDLRKERDRIEDEILAIHKSVNKLYLYTAEKVLELAKNAKSLWLSRSREEQVEFMEKLLWNSSMSRLSIDFNRDPRVKLKKKL